MGSFNAVRLQTTAIAAVLLGTTAISKGHLDLLSTELRISSFGIFCRWSLNHISADQC